MEIRKGGDWKTGNWVLEDIYLQNPANLALFAFHFERLCGSDRLLVGHEQEEPVQVVDDVGVVRGLGEGELVVLDADVTELGRVEHLPEF